MTETKKVIKTVYLYDEDGYFVDTHIGQPNPKRPNAWLLPPNCSLVKPAMQAKVFYRIKRRNDPSSDWEAIPYPSSPDEFVGIEIPHKSRTMHNEVLRKWLRSFVAADPVHWREKQINDSEGNLIAITIDAIPQPTEEELKEQAAASARAKRDYLLSETDYLLQPDYPVTEDQLEQVKSYRQSLRDLPAQKGFPGSIDWPAKPQFLK